MHPQGHLSSSPLFFQGQAGVNAAGLGVGDAAGVAGWRRRRGRGPQDLLGPAFLPQVLMLLRRLGQRVLGLPGECGVRHLLFGLAFRAVKLCCGEKRDEGRCQFMQRKEVSSNFVPKPPVNIKIRRHDESCKM